MQGITTVELTEHAQRLIEAIRAGGGELVDRLEIAKHIGRTVNGADIALLDILAANGVIEAVKQDTKAPSKFKMLYRVIGD